MTAERAIGEVELFTQSHCAPCRQIEAFLRKREIPYVRRDVAEDPDALEELASRGYMATPVLRVDEEWVVGFNQNALRRLFG